MVSAAVEGSCRRDRSSRCSTTAQRLRWSTATSTFGRARLTRACIGLQIRDYSVGTGRMKWQGTPARRLAPLVSSRLLTARAHPPAHCAARRSASPLRHDDLTRRRKNGMSRLGDARRGEIGRFAGQSGMVEQLVHRGLLHDDRKQPHLALAVGTVEKIVAKGCGCEHATTRNEP